MKESTFALGLTAVVALVAAVGLGTMWQSGSDRVVVMDERRDDGPGNYYIGPPERADNQGDSGAATPTDDLFVGPPERDTTSRVGDAAAGRVGSVNDRCMQDVRRMKETDWKRPCTMQLANLQCPYDASVSYVATDGCEVSFLKRHGWTEASTGGGIR